MRLLRIGEASRILGVDPGTLRKWDEEGIFRPVITSKNGLRWYTDTQIEDLFKTTTREANHNDGSK
jgi:DNA-binding transcriptional MerR regulator